MRDAVLAAIGDDLRLAARRLRIRRRRRRARAALAAAGLLAALLAVAGAGAGGDDPLAFLRTPPAMAPPAAHVQRLDLELRGRAGAWHVVVYRSRQGMLCDTAELPGRHRDEVGCWNVAYGLATAPRTDGDIGLGFHLGPDGRRLIEGTVPGGVDRVTFEDRSGVHQALLSSRTMTVPVVVPRGGLQGVSRRTVAKLPHQLVVRAYAVELARHPHAGHWSRRELLAAPRLRIRVHLRDGRTIASEGPPGSG